jgi:hypothetical protein
MLSNNVANDTVRRMRKQVYQPRDLWHTIYR